jgi:hypothetical protein
MCGETAFKNIEDYYDTEESKKKLKIEGSD